MTKKAFLIILDGWGHGKDSSVSAIAQAKTPFIDDLYNQYPNAELVTYGEEVGLPKGQMGNSEVGHLNIGAGRTVYQELARINKAVAEHTLEKEQTLVSAINYAKENNKPFHLMGLLSDGGVHSHIDHTIAICKILSQQGIKTFIHCFMDGRDTSPAAGLSYLKKLDDNIDKSRCEISTIIGRYYAMDRDNRWERIKLAYDLLVDGKGTQTSDFQQTIKELYKEKVTDEFLPPIKIGDTNKGCIKNGDVVFFTNFRTDRPRQLTYALSQEPVDAEGMKPLDLYYMTMTNYDTSFINVKVIFEKKNIKNTMGEVIAKNGLSQLRIAETEKYPHVTFFLSGGREAPFEKEERIVINSPKVATYDMQPEMSAYEVTNAVHKSIVNNHPDLIILNYANADMVGHTGIMKAAIKAAETLDSCLESLIPIAIKADYNIVIIADHGNSDIMINKDGSPHTAHTTNQVPVIIIGQKEVVQEVKEGTLADIAPTILKLMGVKVPNEMTGKSLIN